MASRQKGPMFTTRCSLAEHDVLGWSKETGFHGHPAEEPYPDPLTPHGFSSPSCNAN